MPLPLDLYQRLVDTVRDYAIFALDSQGHVLSWNEGARDLKLRAVSAILTATGSLFPV
jgi:osomolarity two-component system sensor histidine kinase TcsA